MARSSRHRDANGARGRDLPRVCRFRRPLRDLRHCGRPRRRRCSHRTQHGAPDESGRSCSSITTHRCPRDRMSPSARKRERRPHELHCDQVRPFQAGGIETQVDGARSKLGDVPTDEVGPCEVIIVRLSSVARPRTPSPSHRGQCTEILEIACTPNGVRPRDQLAEALALVTLGTTAHSPHLVLREDALPIGAVVVIVVYVTVPRLPAFRGDRVIGPYFGHAGSLFVVDRSVTLGPVEQFRELVR